MTPERRAIIISYAEGKSGTYVGPRTTEYILELIKELDNAEKKVDEAIALMTKGRTVSA